MKGKVFVGYLQSLALGIFFVFSFYSNAEAFDFTDWDGLIIKYVTPRELNGISFHAFDYERLKADPVFSNLVSRLNSFPLDNLQSRDAKLTFWINVYNILAVKMIADNFPIESIKDVGNFFSPVWKRPAGKVAGKERTLNGIEHEILRKMDEPRIHVAIVCASISCPDIRLESYTVAKLSDQLDDQMKMFLSSQEKGMRLDEKKNRVYLSRIFKWFAEDFESRGGVLNFIAQYVNPEERKAINKSQIKISYLDYNWKINGQ